MLRHHQSSALPLRESNSNALAYAMDAENMGAAKPAANQWPATRTSKLMDFTPASRTRPSSGTPQSTSSGGNSAAGGMTESPQSAARHGSGRPTPPRSAVKLQPFITPQKSLFQRYLLRDLETFDRKPHVTIVLDLDETLVSNRRADLPKAILRPYVLHFLNAIRQMENIEIVLWTASTRETGAPVVEQLHCTGIIFDDVIFRSDLWFTEPIHTKDLRLLGRDMDRVVVIDNAPNCCKLNPTNSVLIEDFLGHRTESDASLVNSYYVVEALNKGCGQGRSVKEVFARLEAEAHLVKPVHFALPDAWHSVNLRDIAPLKVPPHGKYLRVLSNPPSASTMQHWSF